MITFIKKHFVIILAVIVLLLFFLPNILTYVSGGTGALDAMKVVDVSLGTTSVSAWVADNEDLRTKGFSGIKKISIDQGMLFVFPKSGSYGFWMNKMLMPIDIIWVDEKFTVVHIEKSVSPETFPKTFFPTKASKYVLETKSGFSEMFGINSGDKINFTLEE